MTRPRLLLSLYVGSVAVKALAGLLISQPGYMDAYYYYHVAANLAAGRGFVGISSGTSWITPLPSHIPATCTGFR